MTRTKPAIGRGDVRRRLPGHRVRARLPASPPRPGLLAGVSVISGISGGSLLAALCAYGPEDFADFDHTTTSLVTGGLQRVIARRAAAPRARAHCRRPASPGGRREAGSGAAAHRTDALVQALAARPFGQRQLGHVTHPGLATVITATDLATGNAVRFGSARARVPGRQHHRTGHRRRRVAAQPAFPLLLPHLSAPTPSPDARHPGTRALLLTDGGVYDNLGLTPLLPRRSADHTSHVYDLDYIIAVDAGQGR